MQQIRFEQEKMNSYMVVPCVAKLDRNSYGEEILEHAKIPGLMNYEIREIDGEQTLYYRLKYRTSLKQVLGDLELTFELVKTMLTSIVDVVKQTEEYLLDANAIIWKSEYIFVEVHSGRLSFAYYPKAKNKNNAIKNLLMELIQYVEENNQQTYLCLMGFYNIVTNLDCTREQMEEYLAANCMEKKEQDSEICKEDEKVGTCFEQEDSISVFGKEAGKFASKKSWLVIAILAGVNLVVTCLLLFDIWTYQYIWVLIVTLFLLFVVFLTYHPEKEDDHPDKIMEEYMNEYRKEQNKEYQQQKEQREAGVNIKKTALWEEKDAIVVEDVFTELCLKSLNPKEFHDLMIEENSMVLGRMKSGCNYLIKQGEISRMHAKIVKKEDGLFLIDLNSTNGTYLNDEKIVGGTEYLLQEGDVISLAKMVTFVVAENVVDDGLNKY